MIRIFLFSMALLLSNTISFAESKSLENKIWHVSSNQFVSFSKLLEEVLAKHYVIIGERHGRIAHQNREAFILAAMANKKRYPSLVLEMLTHDQTKIVSAFREKSPEIPQALATQLNWHRSNWPAWIYYQPVFETAFTAKLPIIGADIRDHQKKQILSGKSMLISGDNPIRKSWSQTLRKSHCNLVGEQRLKNLTDLQIARDRAMAHSAKLAATLDHGVVIIAGSAHTRKDRGISLYLPKEKTLVLALVETNRNRAPETHLPKSIRAKIKAYDYVWFTKNNTSRNVCKRLKF